MDFKLYEEDRLYGLRKIVKTKEYYMACNEYIENEKNQDSWNFFNDKNWRISEKIVSYRLINYWEKKGLIPNTREENGGWRKYSLIDIIWIYIIKDLSSWGLKLEDILGIRKLLCSGYNQCEYGEFEYYTALAFYNKIPVNIIIYYDEDESKFKGELAALYEILDTEKKYGLGNHFSFSLNSLLENLFPEQNLKPCFDSYNRLSKNESDVYKIIKDDKVRELSIIKSKNGKIDQITFTVNEEPSSNIGELKSKNAYQEISIKHHNSKTTSIKRTISKKFNKDE